MALSTDVPPRPGARLKGYALHLPLEVLDLLFLQRLRARGDEEDELALRRVVDQPAQELKDGVEAAAAHEGLPAVDRDPPALALLHELLDHVNDSFQGRRDRLHRRALPLREPQDPIRRDVVLLAHALGVLAGHDQAPGLGPTCPPP